MKIAVVSDIHSNLAAWTSVLKNIQKRGITNIFCLGDIVGYGPFPSECLKEVREYCQKIVMGNHEDTVVNIPKEFDMGRLAREGVVFSRKRLSSEEISFIGNLPTKVDIPEIDMVLCHGSFSEPNAWNYIDSSWVAENEMVLTDRRICVVGHTHTPFVYSNIRELHKEIEDDMELEKNEKFIINVGSVGQPRDGDCRASYGIFDIGDKIVRFTLERVFYNIGKTERAMKEQNISSFLSERLFKGE